jgi:hypothetical protein
VFLLFASVIALDFNAGSKTFTITTSSGMEAMGLSKVNVVLPNFNPLTENVALPDLA